MKDRTKFWFWLPVFVFLPIGLWFGTRGAGGPTPAGETVLATASFPDDTRIEIFRVEATDQMELHSGKRRAPWSKWFRTSSNRTWAGGFSFKSLETHEHNGRWDRSVFQTHYPGLILLARAHGIPSDVFRDYKGKGVEISFDPKTGSFRRLGNSSISAPLRQPRWTVDVADGEGGWLECVGPLLANANDPRAFLRANAFPRNKAEITLRISRLGQDPILVDVSNPDHVTDLPAWTKDAVEFEHPFDQFRLVSDPQTRDYNATRKWLDAGLRFFPRGDGQFPNSWETKEILISDELGNQAGRGSFHPLPGYQFIRVTGEVHRAARYVWPIEETAIVAEVVMPATIFTNPAVFGELECEVLTVGSEMGVENLKLKITDGGDIPEWEFTITGNGEKTFVDSLVYDGLVVFVEDDDRTFGSRGFGGGGNWSSSTGSTESRFNLQVNWIGDLSPNTKIRIAVPNPTPPQTFEFVFPRKAFEGWRSASDDTKN